MKITEALKVKYVADASGKKTDVLVPVEVWEALLASWQQMVEQLEEQEDVAIFTEWLRQRSSVGVETISLDDLEQELYQIRVNYPLYLEVGCVTVSVTHRQGFSVAKPLLKRGVIKPDLVLIADGLLF